MSASDSNLIRQIRSLSPRSDKLNDDELQKQSLGLKYQAMTGRSLKGLIPQGFALVVEAARRHLGYSHYDVQLECGIRLVLGQIAEMKTGEGKTLTASLPVFLQALAGRGAHVITVNDYLAVRDRELLRPVYDALGLSSAVITSEMEPDQRSRAYRKDITYGSAKEFGFDFLRDRMKRLRLSESGLEPSPERLVMRGLQFALVDEADSILIDEARTPLIIGMVDRTEEAISQDCFYWASASAAEFIEDEDFTYDHLHQKVKLSIAGRNRLRQIPQNNGSTQVSIRELYAYMENAIKVRRDFQLDKNYAIRDGKIVIIDEFTGRPAEGRQWQQGIHQSVEAKEGVEITPATRQAARVTAQNFFRKYRYLAGMTGTAWTSRREFSKVYNKKVSRIRTNRPVQRQTWPVKVYGDFISKMNAVRDEIVQVIKQGRAVLIGTRSVAKSELLSKLLTDRKVIHKVLNARHLESEADIVAAAGQPQSVTVATNMAGRGTDIKLHDIVRNHGGLHVILTEIHESQRIDWQLIGRGSRQGDPGSYRIFVALDDEILEMGLGPSRAKRLRHKYNGSQEVTRSAFNYFRLAQRKAERRHLVDRMILLKQDKERLEHLFETGQDPYLDVVE